jgi:hypothetical protein
VACPASRPATGLAFAAQFHRPGNFDFYTGLGQDGSTKALNEPDPPFDRLVAAWRKAGPTLWFPNGPASAQVPVVVAVTRIDGFSVRVTESEQSSQSATTTTVWLQYTLDIFAHCP